MRSQCGNRLFGMGTKLAFLEVEEHYQDQRAGLVRFPSDYLSDDALAKLSGECVTIRRGGDEQHEG